MKKICHDMILPGDLLAPNQPTEFIGGRAAAISLKEKRWPVGSVLTIGFLGGSGGQQRMVKRVAPEWTEHANLNFRFITNPFAADIRVEFRNGEGAWSYVGTDNRNIPRRQATMNLGWQDEGVILHEFGHMIGLSHEHQNPDGGIKWNEDTVIRDLSGPPNYWTEAQIRRNVLNKYRVDQLNGTTFDPDSVMLYPFPASWTTNGVSTKGNDDLSVTDKDFIASALMYPGKDEPADMRPLNVVPSVAAEIKERGELDLYRLAIENSGEYTIATFGQIDLVTSVMKGGQLIARDDDSGAGRNSMIRTFLEAGVYEVEVRHWSAQGRGEYKVIAF